MLLWDNHQASHTLSYSQLVAFRLILGSNFSEPTPSVNPYITAAWFAPPAHGDPSKVKEEVSRWFSTCHGDSGDPRCCPDAGQRWGAGGLSRWLTACCKKATIGRREGETKVHLAEWTSGLREGVPYIIVIGFPLTFESCPVTRGPAPDRVKRIKWRVKVSKWMIRPLWVKGKHGWASPPILRWPDIVLH